MSTQHFNPHNAARNVGLHSNIFNLAGGVRYPFPGGSLPRQAPPPVFNDAPLDLLSVNFTGREKELNSLSEILYITHEDVPTRCVIHGMHGLGKTQLALQFAKSSYSRGRYSSIFWISGTTVDKLHSGFLKILHLVRHPERPHIGDQSSKLTEARRWLEHSGAATWLLVLDNVDIGTLDFIRENLPRQNRRGNIIFTTRTSGVASALSHAAGKQHHLLELELPNAQDAVNLLLREGSIDAASATWLTMSKANEITKCVGRLPLAISQAGSFMRQCDKELDYTLLLLQSEQRMQVRADAISSIYSHCSRTLKGNYMGEPFMELRAEVCCRDICLSSG
jgi:hypothetical protein